MRKRETKSLVGSVAVACAPLFGACAPTTPSFPERSGSVSRPQIWGGSRVAEGDSLAGTTVALIGSNGFPFCTGSFMGGNVVLTAAHCVARLESPLFYVSFDLEAPTALDPIYGDRGIHSPRARRVVRSAMHSSFDKSRFSATNIRREPNAPLNDVALVFFEGAAPVGARAVSLVGPSLEIDLNTEITLAGFGKSDAQGGDYGRLYKVVTHVGDIRNRSLEIVDGPNSDKGSCVGDSGGPVFVTEGSAGSGGRLTVAGVVSYGPKDCERGTGFNTDLRFFREWVTVNAGWDRALRPPLSAVPVDMDTFVPRAEGSFFQVCRDRHARPADHHTVEVILAKLGTSDCEVAARHALRVSELDLSHRGIQDIGALRHFVSLRKLNLSYNEITELEPISYLGKLEELNLVEAGVSWQAYKHPRKLAPWGLGTAAFHLERHVGVGARGWAGLQGASGGPYSPGIWLTALRRLESLVVEPGAGVDRTERFAGASRPRPATPARPIK